MLSSARRESETGPCRRVQATLASAIACGRCRARSSCSAPAASSGANLLRMLLAARDDVVGTTSRSPAWRLEDLPAENVREVDLLVDPNVDQLLDDVRPRTIFNCIAYGAYSFETDGELILRTNLMSTHALVRASPLRNIAAYVHAGSSSEYGDNAAGPDEHAFPRSNSDYAVSKAACAHLLHYYGKKRGFPCANLRLYSVFGPLEDPSRLIPNDRAARAARRAARRSSIRRSRATSSTSTTSARPSSTPRSRLRAGHLRRLVQHRHGPQDDDRRGRGGRARPVRHRRSHPVPRCRLGTGTSATGSPTSNKPARRSAGSRARPLRDGLGARPTWYEACPATSGTSARSKSSASTPSTASRRSSPATRTTRRSRSCTSGSRRRSTKLKIDYEIIFVNDCSPDDSEEVIREISATRPARDRHLALAQLRLAVGIPQRHGARHEERLRAARRRPAGPARADRAVRGAVAGGLRRRLRPPRQARGAVLHAASPTRRSTGCSTASPIVPIPHDAGDFSLMDRRVVQAMLQLPRARPLPARHPRLRRLQPDRRGLRPPRAHVRRDHEQPAEEHRLGEEGHPLVQQRAAHDAQLRRHRAAGAEPRARRARRVSRALARPGQHAGRASRRCCC